MIALRRLSSADADFSPCLSALLAFEATQDEAVERAVAGILADVKARGDAAVIEYTNRFDRLAIASLAELEIAGEELRQALAGLPAAQREALEIAAQRVRRYHEHQLQHSWQYEEDGMLLGQKVTPLARVGLYVPGGKAAAGQDPVPSKFKSVREGTFRAALLRAMDGTKTVAEIAAESGKAASLVLSHAFCLTRDCGIGYSTKDGKLTVVFPEGKTIADAIAPVKSAA